MRTTASGALALLLSWLTVAAAPAGAQLLADQPLFTSATVPGNVALVLSVEYPTALSPAYPSTVAYTSSTPYLGYFDPVKCYRYNYDATTDANNYFVPAGLADANQGCAGTLWSGSFLNWATMQTIDPFRWALTGGYRVIDTPSLTVLERAWASGNGGSGQFPNKALATSALVAGATPFNWNALNVRVWGLGNKIFFSGATTTTTASGGLITLDGVSLSSAGPLNGTTTASTPVAHFNPANAGAASSSNFYWVYARVKVCDPASANGGVESNCTLYGTNYKPEGLMQQYAMKVRFSAFGYLNDSSSGRDGGVLRARMKYVGPQAPSPGQSPVTNALAEWDAGTGVYVTNPDPADATATQALLGAGSAIANSGVMNYLNKFGQTSRRYKSYDPVSELYYAAYRYFKGLKDSSGTIIGNVPEYTAMSSNTSTNQTYADDFPVITAWDDPILYSCQKNFIIGIGDVNTHYDTSLPGSTINGNEGHTLPAAVAANAVSDYTTANYNSKGVNVMLSTNQIGAMEALTNSSIPGNLGTASWGNYASYFIAGLAYDAHTRDQRPGEFLNADGTKSIIQTISTYWLDVQEYQSYASNNQFYMAAKYGGFNVASNYNPYPATPVALSTAQWHTNSDTLSSRNPRPDNYFSAGQADKMVAGLKSAFANIASKLTEASTAFTVSSPQVSTSGNVSYAAQYDAATWSGQILASLTSFDASGNPSLTQQWDARQLLETQAASGGWSSKRFIATCCDPSGKAFPFEVGSLSGSNPVNFANLMLIPDGTTATGANVLNYLRGDRSNEVGAVNASGNASGTQAFRSRAYLLGDIVNSKTNPVGAPAGLLSDSFNPGYASFSSTWKNRKTMVYAGANDGMVHAFDGSIGASTSGAEVWAYIPGFLFRGPTATPTTNGLVALTSKNFVHHYYVDATPEAFDVDMKRAGGLSNNDITQYDWRTILIGGLGKGGKGYYAIDVTDPNVVPGAAARPPAGTSAVVAGETALAGKVLWEFSDSRMGYSYGSATVVKTKKYGWVAILTSGYGNADGVGYFFFVNPATGALLETVSTGAGSVSAPAGLAAASAYVTNYADGTADALYAGDLLGNVWRLDLTPASGNYAAPIAIAKLTDATSSASSPNPQPVTTRPLIEIQPNSLKRYVLIGTGRMLDTSDIVGSGQQQTFYGIIDGTSAAFSTPATLPNGITFPISRANMIPVSSDTSQTVNLLTGIGSNPDASRPMGWYVDLAVSSGGIPERVNTTPTSNFGVVAFAANLPNGDVCNPSGTNRVFALNLGTGQSVLVNTSLVQMPYSTALGGVITDLNFLNINGIIRLQAGNDLKQVVNVPGTYAGAGTVTRLNWRELPTAD